MHRCISCYVFIKIYTLYRIVSNIKIKRVKKNTKQGMKNISGITDAYALEIDDYLIGIGSYRQDSNGT